MSEFCFKLVLSMPTQVCYLPLSNHEPIDHLRSDLDPSNFAMLDNRFNDTILFENLDPDQRTLVQPLFTQRLESEGSELFKQGDPVSCLFIVIDGEVCVKYKPEDGPALTVARVRPESVVGWSAVLGNPNYTSSAVCSTDCTLLCVNGEDLRKLCNQHPDICSIILNRLAIMIAERLRNTHGHVIALLKQGLQINVQSKLPAEQLQETS